MRQVFLGIGLLFGPFIGTLITQYCSFVHMYELYALLFLLCLIIEMLNIMKEKRESE